MSKYGNKCNICNVSFSRSDITIRHMKSASHRNNVKLFVESVLTSTEITDKKTSEIVNDLKEQIIKLQNQLCTEHKEMTKICTKMTENNKGKYVANRGGTINNNYHIHNETAKPVKKTNYDSDIEI